MKLNNREDKCLKVYIKEYEKLTGKSFLQDSKKEPNLCDIYNRLYVFFGSEYKKNPDDLWCRKVWDKAHGEMEKTIAMQSNTDIILIAIHFPIFIIIGSFINKLSITYLLYLFAYFIWILGFSLIRVSVRCKKLYKANFKILCVSIMERVLNERDHKLEKNGM